MQGDFECLLNIDGFKHIVNETGEYVDSKIQSWRMMTDQTDIRRKTGDGRWRLILNEIDATRCEFVGSKQVGFC